MADPIPAGRLQLSQVVPKQYAAMFRLERSIELDPVIRELVKIRASQINGCAFCIDMHWQDARGAGETEERLYLLNAWRESPGVYSDRERAALDLCEAVTLIASNHVPDEVWERAAAVFDEQELAQLLFAISSINTWNRLMIAARQEPGHYQPAATAGAASTA
jgi:AhpD family alkylhydroperoxidase